jgi:SNF2 family DNA or RNA helicase
MTLTRKILISRVLLSQAAELARQCASATAQERALISQSVALAIRDHLQEGEGIETENGRSAALKYVDLLDVCDFKARDWHVEIRVITGASKLALYVPTMPLMVGILSDFYVCAQVDPALTSASLFGYARRADLAEAELSPNGMFAILAVDDLRSLDQLPDDLRKSQKFNSEPQQAFEEWKARADRIIRGVNDLLTVEGIFGPEQMELLAAGVCDDILRIYGEQLPETGLEHLFKMLFYKFGIDRPVPSDPASPIVFKNRVEERLRFNNPNAREDFFQDNLNVRERVSLYRYLLDDENAFDEHRQTRRALDQATGGKHLTAPRRRERLTKSKARRAQSSWVEPPPRSITDASDSRDGEEGAKKLTRLEDLQPGTVVKGILPDSVVTVIAVKHHGSDVIELTYKDSLGRLGSELVFRDREPMLEIATVGRPWSFDADGHLLRLVSEAHRIRLAYLFDPLLAVHTSLVEPLPHQITAVYSEMLTRQPLRFLLADDPGAGKTIMAGLLIKELLIRGDLRRCLIVCPGMLVEQWQDELSRKFNLPFEIMTNDKLESARTGNWFKENPLAICRLDKLSRNADIQAKLEDTDWDLIVCDEAHKMSASFFGGEVNYTKRYRLGQLLSRITRHFLLMTATPHNGKEADFQLFMALLDGDRFEGKFRDGVHSQDTTDLMRRLVKERLLKFDGTPLFPERLAYTLNYPLSKDEAQLYKEVTDYVHEEFNRANALENDGRKGTVGFALTVLQRRLASSPEAIYQSLKRRKERLERRLKEERLLNRGANVRIEADPGLRSITLEDLDDLDDAPETEIEETEEQVVDQATAARTIAELETEISMLAHLEELALRVRRSGTDKKWEELSGLLQNNAEMFDPNGQRRKLVIFSEHRDTLNYLADKIRGLLGRPEAVVSIHGGMGREERRKAQEGFTQDKEVLVLVATDAAGEGINLQRAHLMVNYDLPWNPNRLEQRFGRIHRIGQTEVCHLWNLVAAETREGAVFQTLCKKLEEESKALRGQIFDVLGKAFSDTPLRELLMEAIRYGDRPEVRARLTEVIDKALDRDHLRALIEERALVHDSMDVARVHALREDMERAEARRLQPHFVADFFLEAFRLLGGQVRKREPRRYEITYVPAPIRRRDRLIGVGEPVLDRYERITFEKDLISVPGKPLASFICPGHPLLDATVDLILERYRDLPKRGAVLVDPNDQGREVRALFYLEHSIQDGRTDATGNRSVVSRHMQFVEIDSHGEAHGAGYAPYLDYRPLTEDESPLVMSLLEADWLKRELESQVLSYAVAHLVPDHFNEVKDRKEALINKTAAAVKDRLTKEIAYWDHRAADLHAQEQAGQTPRLNSAKARQRADDLQVRLQKRLEELEQERRLSPLPPVVIGGALIVPAGLLGQLKGQPQDVPSDFARDRRVVERLAMEAVMATERRLGFEPRDVGSEKLGYDVESRTPNEGRLRFLEVKGRVAGARTVTVTKNEILTALNKPDNFILALAEIGDNVVVRYLREPFSREPDFFVTSVNYEFDELWNRAETPR